MAPGMVVLPSNLLARGEQLGVGWLTGASKLDRKEGSVLSG